MLPLTFSQQRPPGSTIWRGSYSPRHQRGALDGKNSQTRLFKLTPAEIVVIEVGLEM